MSTIQTGKLLGRFMPSSSPVTMAEPSDSDGCRFMIYFDIAHSKNMQAATLDRQTTTEPSPKKRNDTSRAGNSASTTPYMFFSTLSVPCACGDSETISLLIISWRFLIL